MKRQIPGVFSGPGRMDLRTNPNPQKHKGVYFGDAGGGLYFYDSQTGLQKRVAAAGKGISSITESNGVVYFSSWDEKLHSYDSRDGQQRSVNAGEIVSCISVCNGVLYYGDYRGGFYSCNPEMRERRQIAQVGDKISCMAELNGTLYFGSINSCLYSYSLDPANGEHPARTEPKPVAKAGDWISCAARSGGSIYFGCYNDSLYSYNPRTRRQRKAVFTSSRVECMAERDGVIYFGVYDGSLWSLNHTTRKRKQLADFMPNAFCYMTELDGLLYLGCHGATMHGETMCSCNLETGEREKVAEADGDICCAVAVKNAT